jgi:hypothetical protein
MVLFVIAVMAVAPGSALAGDPLLSGYGGPGRGEQAVLGDKLLPAKGSGGGGSLQARPAPKPVAPAPAAGTVGVTPGSVSAPSAVMGKQTTGSSSRTSGTSRKRAGDRARPHKPTTTRNDTSRATPASAHAPQLVAYPQAERGTGGLPFSGADAVIGLLGIVVLTFMALGLRRLVSGGMRPPGA